MENFSSLSSLSLSVLGPRMLAMVALVALSGFFSGSETALFSLSRGQRERLSRSQVRADRHIAVLLAKPRRLIATILIGNELVNITFSSMSAGVIERLVPGWSGISVIAAATAVTVPLLLIFGEITPKSLAIRVAERWARFVAGFLRVFARVVTPIRLIVEGIAGSVLYLFGRGRPAAPAKGIGEEEFKALVDVGSEAGELGASERRLIHRVFEFGDRTVAEIMTPVARVFALSYELPLHRLRHEVARRGLSRVPIYRGRRSDIVGILHAKDLVSLGTPSGRATIKDLLYPPIFVPRNTTCDRLFRLFQRKRMHIALVVDEYGRVLGLVTMDDLLEELFGEIRDEKDRPIDESQAAPVAPTEGA
ncbi:MAG: hemolysin family protein [Pseudomonadota bacterium]